MADSVPWTHPGGRTLLKGFISYTAKDESTRQELVLQLQSLADDHRIRFWTDRMLRVGEDWEGRIAEELVRADIALFIITPAAMRDGGYIRSKELPVAKLLTGAGRLTVIPVLAEEYAYDAAFRLRSTHPSMQPAPHIKGWISSYSSRSEWCVAVRRSLEDVLARPDAFEHGSAPGSAELDAALVIAQSAVEDAEVKVAGSVALLEATQLLNLAAALTAVKGSLQVSRWDLREDLATGLALLRRTMSALEWPDGQNTLDELVHRLDAVDRAAEAAGCPAGRLPPAERRVLAHRAEVEAGLVALTAHLDRAEDDSLTLRQRGNLDGEAASHLLRAGTAQAVGSIDLLRGLVREPEVDTVGIASVAEGLAETGTGLAQAMRGLSGQNSTASEQANDLSHRTDEVSLAASAIAAVATNELERFAAAEIRLAEQRVLECLVHRRPILDADLLTVRNLNFIRYLRSSSDAELIKAIKKFSDLSPLGGAVNLEQLHLSYTAVRNFASLVGLPKLQRLYLRDTKIGSVGSVSNLTRLKSLDVGQTAIEDLSGIEALTQLEFLCLEGLALQSLSPLSALTNLRSLDLTSVRRNRPVVTHPGKVVVDLRPTPFLDITSLGSLTNLRALGLSATRIQDIEALSNLTELESLDIEGTPLTDISPLANCPKLRVLTIRSCDATDLSPLSGCKNLENLFVDDTRVTNLEPLSGLPNLKRLGIRGTDVVDLDPLSRIETLEWVDVGGLTPRSYKPVAHVARLIGMVE